MAPSCPSSVTQGQNSPFWSSENYEEREAHSCRVFVGRGRLQHDRRPCGAEENAGAVFAMTNSASNNQILRTQEMKTVRSPSLARSQPAATVVEGLSIRCSRRALFNSAQITAFFSRSMLEAERFPSFAVHGSALTLVDIVTTDGSFPNAVAQSGSLLYVLDAGGSGNVTGFRIAGNGSLIPIHNSTRVLSGTSTSPSSVVFSPNGQFLVVAESATNNIDVFRVARGGTLSNLVVTPSAGVTPFDALFAPNGTLIAGNASNSVSSYSVQSDGSLVTISNQIPTLGMATCWGVSGPTAKSSTKSMQAPQTSRALPLQAMARLPPVAQRSSAPIPQAARTSILRSAMTEGLSTLSMQEPAPSVFSRSKAMGPSRAENRRTVCRHQPG